MSNIREIINEYGIVTPDLREFYVTRPIDKDTYKDLRRNRSKEIMSVLTADYATAKTALPTLQGSEKQVNWANDIRGRFFVSYYVLRQILSVVGNADSYIKKDPHVGGAAAKLSSLFGYRININDHSALVKETEKVLQSETHARFWIDNNV